MKDSKYRMNVHLSDKEQASGRAVQVNEDDVHAYREFTEGAAAPVLKWEFPEAPEPQAQGGHGRLGAEPPEPMVQGPRGNRGPVSGPDASGKSGQALRAAQTPPPGSLAGARAPHGAAPDPGGPAAMPHGPQPAAGPPRTAPAAEGRAPRGGRTFRARPRGLWRRGYAARRRPAAGRRRVRVHPAVWAIAGLLALALALPLLVVAPGNDQQAPLPPGQAPAPSAEPQAAEEPMVSVYLTRTDTVEELPLETYLVGVLAAEMPAEFQPEALKAQAIAARTYIVQRLLSGDRSGVPDPKAVVTDTISHQAYLSQDQLEKEWKQAGKEAELSKLKRAVDETKGMVMTYQGKPITASFFSTSNGFTENSEDYWKNEIPYLRSVESPWDIKISPKYKTTVTMNRAEFIDKLGLADGAIPVSAGGQGSGAPIVKILSYTEGHRIERLKVGDKTFTGREVREKLGLKSSQFSFKMIDGKIEITTYGNGHGVGMSQYGAEGMAREGYKAQDILKHYYTGISFDQTSNLLSSKK